MKTVWVLRLAYFPQAQEQSDGKHKILFFEEGMQQQVVKWAMTCDYEGAGHKDIVSHRGYQFDGQFRSGCQCHSMLFNGADLR
jgi:hypothetical protein